MDTVLVKREQFYILRPPKWKKTDLWQVQIVMGNERYTRRTKHTATSLYWRCALRKTKCSVHFQTDLAMTKILYPLCFTLVGAATLSYEKYVTSLQTARHEAHPCSHGWSQQKQDKERVERGMHLHMSQGASTRDTWVHLNKHNPLQAVALFPHFAGQRRNLYRRYKRPLLMRSQSDLKAMLQDPNNVNSMNHWARQRRCSDTFLSNNQNVCQKYISSSAQELQAEEERLRKDIDTLSAELHFVSLRLETCSPAYFHSSFIWNYDLEHNIVVFGSFHGGLRLINPITNLCANNVSLTNMIDGIFRTPRLGGSYPWLQLLQIHVVVSSPSVTSCNKSFPCMWALLPTKEERCYKMLIRLVNDGFRKRGIASLPGCQDENASVRDALCTAQRTHSAFVAMKDSQPVESQVSVWRPDSINLDFEKGLINAFKTLSKIDGCFFHFLQSIIRKIGKLGLRKEYMKNQTFRMKIVELGLVAFLPPEDVKSSVKRILVELKRTVGADKHLRILTFGTYFRRTWFRRFPPDLCSVFRRKNRTSNLVESNNKELKSKLPQMCVMEKYIATLVEFDCTATTDYERLMIHGAKAFPGNVVVDRQYKEEMLWFLMNKYVTTEMSEKQYLETLQSVYAKRLKDKVRAADVLSKYQVQPSPQSKLPRSAKVLEDHFKLKVMRCKIWDDALTDKAHKHVTQHSMWEQVTKCQNIKRYVGRNELVKVSHMVNLLNCFVLIKYQDWTYAFVAMLEDDTALIFTKHDVRIVDNFRKSIKKKHVRFV